MIFYVKAVLTKNFIKITLYLSTGDCSHGRRLIGLIANAFAIVSY